MCLDSGPATSARLQSMANTIEECEYKYALVPQYRRVQNRSGNEEWNCAGFFSFVLDQFRCDRCSGAHESVSDLIRSPMEIKMYRDGADPSSGAANRVHLIKWPCISRCESHFDKKEKTPNEWTVVCASARTCSMARRHGTKLCCRIG